MQRFGIAWTEARLAGTRDPHLRKRVPRERLTTCWAGVQERAQLDAALSAFAAQLQASPAPQVVRQGPRPALALAEEPGDD